MENSPIGHEKNQKDENDWRTIESGYREIPYINVGGEPEYDWNKRVVYLTKILDNPGDLSQEVMDKVRMLISEAYLGYQSDSNQMTDYEMFKRKTFHRDYVDLRRVEARNAVNDNIVELWQKAGKPEKAAEFYESKNKWKVAAELWRTLGKDADALRCYEKGGDWEEASKVCEKLGDLEKALELYQKSKTYLLNSRAGYDQYALDLKDRIETEKFKTYVKKGQYTEAEAMVKAFDRNNSQHAIMAYRTLFEQYLADQMFLEAERINNIIQGDSTKLEDERMIKVYEALGKVKKAKKLAESWAKSKK